MYDNHARGKMKDKSIELNKLYDLLVNLKDSPLYDFRVNNNYFPVIGCGSHDAEIMFIGEAPGRNEAKTGKPFCGAAGRILDQLLDHIGKKRENIYITNIVKDRPPENRDPTKEEIEIYGPFLNKEIDIIKPKIIATLGRYSMSYIMKLFGIDSSIEPIGVAHGKKFKAKSNYGEIDIVILYHPCVAIYNPKKINILKDDIKILTTIK